MRIGNQVGVKNNQPDRQTDRRSGLTLIGYLIPSDRGYRRSTPYMAPCHDGACGWESPGTDRQTGSLFDLC